MPLPREFLLVWRKWLRATPPTERYRSGDKNHSTYGIEVTLDHVRTSVESLVQALMEGKPWNYVRRANEELAELQLVRFLLEKEDDDRAKTYLSYIALTEELLHAIMEIGAGS